MLVALKALGALREYWGCLERWAVKVTGSSGALGLLGALELCWGH